MAMNCVLIETDFGMYCDSHRTWHDGWTWSDEIWPHPIPFADLPALVESLTGVSDVLRGPSTTRTVSDRRTHG